MIVAVEPDIVPVVLAFGHGWRRWPCPPEHSSVQGRQALNLAPTGAGQSGRAVVVVVEVLTRLLGPEIGSRAVGGPLVAAGRVVPAVASIAPQPPALVSLLQ